MPATLSLGCLLQRAEIDIEVKNVYSVYAKTFISNMPKIQRSTGSGDKAPDTWIEQWDWIKYGQITVVDTVLGPMVRHYALGYGFRTFPNLL